jgi:hypothetical protein
MGFVVWLDEAEGCLNRISEVEPEGDVFESAEGTAHPDRSKKA